MSITTDYKAPCPAWRSTLQEVQGGTKIYSKDTVQAWEVHGLAGEQYLPL